MSSSKSFFKAWSTGGSWSNSFKVLFLDLGIAFLVWYEKYLGVWKIHIQMNLVFMLALFVLDQITPTKCIKVALVTLKFYRTFVFRLLVLKRSIFKGCMMISLKKTP